MLQSISWSDFFIAIGIALVIYYAFGGLVLFRKEFINIFKQRASNDSASDTQVDQNDSDESNDLLGTIRHAGSPHERVPREEKVDADSINVSPLQEPEEAIELSKSSADDAVLTTVSVLLEEIRVLSASLSKNTKQEAILLFKTILARYRQLIGTEYQDAVNLFIYNSCQEHCEFDLDQEEIETWWVQKQQQ